jgi:hypothetical protein
MINKAIILNPIKVFFSLIREIYNIYKTDIRNVLMLMMIMMTMIMIVKIIMTMMINFQGKKPTIVTVPITIYKIACE